MKEERKKPPYQLCKARQIFASFYIKHFTLLQFLRKIDQNKEINLVQESDIADYEYLLKSTIVAVRGREADSLPFKPRRWYTLREILNRVIENVCRSTGSSINVLALGYEPLSGHNKYGTVAGTTGIQNSYPNTIVSYLRTAKAWEILHERIGDDLMMHLLQNTALFIKIPSSSCYLEVAGHPISRLSPLSVDAAPRIRAKQTTSSSEKIGHTTDVGKKKAKRGGKRRRKSREKAKLEAGLSSTGSRVITCAGAEVAAVEMECANTVVATTDRPASGVTTSQFEQETTNEDPDPHGTVGCRGRKRKHESWTYAAAYADDDKSEGEPRGERAKKPSTPIEVTPELSPEKTNENSMNKAINMFSGTASVSGVDAIHTSDEDSPILFPLRMSEKSVAEPSDSCSKTSDICSIQRDEMDAGTAEGIHNSREGSPVFMPMEKPKIIMKGTKRKHRGGSKVHKKEKVNLTQLLPQSRLSKTPTGECGHKKQKQSERLDSTLSNVSLNGNIYFPRSQMFYASNLSQKIPKRHVMESASVSENGARKLIQEIFLKESLSSGKGRQEKDGRIAKSLRGTAAANSATEEQRLHKGSTKKKKHSRLTRRFIRMQPLFCKLLAGHKRCPYQTLLQHHCYYTERKRRIRKGIKKKVYQRIVRAPTKRKLQNKPSKKKKVAAVNVKVYHHAVNNNTSHNQVSRLLQCICHKVVPTELWGSTANKAAFLLNLDKFVRLGRAEKFSLNQMMTGMKVSQCEWLKSKKNGKRHTIPLSESTKQQELLATFVWWLVTQFLMVVLKSFFYITEGVMHRNRVYYYRKPVWRNIHQFGLNTFCQEFFKPLKTEQAVKLLAKKSSLGCCPLRFLPKTSKVRPITNMRHRPTQKGPTSVQTAAKQQSVNRKLENLFHVIKFEKERDSKDLGATLLGVDDLYKALRHYVERVRTSLENRRPLYFVSLDVNNCYESIVQQKLYDIMEGVLVEEEYLVRRFGLLRMLGAKVYREFAKDVTTADDCMLFPDFFQSMVNKKGLKETVAVDQVWYISEDRRKLLEVLKEHIFNNIVKIGSKYYQQERGIAQGSVLSPLLCSYFYGHMENTRLSAITQDPDSLLLRWVDDFLLITPVKSQAENFLTIMHAGIPEYGCFINHEKTLTNFDAASADGLKVKRIDVNEKFPWCGFLVDQETLDVAGDMSRYTGLLLRDTLTVCLDAHPGQALHQKLQYSVRPKCHPLLLDHTLNSRESVLLNVYQVFLLAALKFDTYIRELPKENQIDGEALSCLTEMASETLIPVMGHRMKFLKLVKLLQNKENSDEASLTPPEVSAPVLERVFTKVDESPGSSHVEEPQTSHQTRKRPAAASMDSGPVVLNARLPWPAVLDLPTTFRPEVVQALKEKDGSKVTKKIRKNFIARIYEHFSRFTLYPTKQQILEISVLIVKAYPFLKDKSVGTGYDSWFAQIYEKFRNERKSIASDPEVILHKRKKNIKGSELIQPVPLKLRRGGINWEPPFPEGEDEISLKRHKEWLQNEAKKKHPDLDKVEKRMALTFSDRRKLMNSKVELADLRTEYPALFNYQQIVAEFERILGVEKIIMATFQYNFFQVKEQIVEIGKTREMKKKRGMEDFLSLLENQSDEDTDCESSQGGQPKDNPSFFCRMILDLAQYFHSTSSHKCRQLSHNEVKFSLDEHEVTWLCFHAFWASLRRKQSRYKELLRFLKRSLKRLVVAEGEFRKIVEASRHAVFKQIH